MKKSVKWKLILVMLVLMGACMLSSKNSADAAGTYQIKINKTANCVTIYKQNKAGKYKAVKALVCSTGYATKTGTYSLGEKIRWHVLDGPCYGQYCTRIYGGVLFHSVWYTGKNNPATLSASAYNKLGTIASHGCVRLTVAGAKWIYDNVPSGTKVIIYENAKNPGPLGKPKAIKLPAGSGWDPTDIWHSQNPWNDKKPKIIGAKNQTVAYGSTFKVKKGVTAKNTTGFNATSLLEVSVKYKGKKVSKVDTTNPGTYKVTYSIVDEIERKAKATVTVKVKAARKKPVIKNVKNLYVKSKSKLTKSFMLKGVKIKQGNKTLPSKYVKVKLTKIKKNVYRITYTAQRESVATVVTARAYIDTVAPKMVGVTDGKSYHITEDIQVNEEYALSLIEKVTDNVSKVKKSEIVVKIATAEEGVSYAVTYTLKDAAGNKVRVAITLTRNELITIQVPDVLEIAREEINCTQDSTSEEVLSNLRTYLVAGAGVTAVSYDNTDVTSSLRMTIEMTKENTYSAIFTAEYDGNTVTKTVIVKVKEMLLL